MMAVFEKWPPGTRPEWLNMGKLWVTVLAVMGALWGLTPAEIAAFEALVDQAEDALAKMTDKTNRTHQDIVHCRAVFKTLRAEMRRIKNNHFQSPPRTAEELAMVGLATRGRCSGRLSRKGDSYSCGAVREVFVLVMAGVVGERKFAYREILVYNESNSKY